MSNWSHKLGVYLASAARQRDVEIGRRQRPAAQFHVHSGPFANATHQQHSAPISNGSRSRFVPEERPTPRKDARLDLALRHLVAEKGRGRRMPGTLGLPLTRHRNTCSADVKQC
ncbi:hypothetical protein HYPDE_34763 [Hyphomicrobium denitrificans 1NES1]|uniref:Uncharacterized protein n=1 Tax=Hyphomicrobium denitrificans 1NES1 TaxID=670307 RepID=N0B531_9HYPH|nr:hypothetical protein HYPDE_34763 [Hyphomicrobium denitrificans 1NES1]